MMSLPLWQPLDYVTMALALVALVGLCLATWLALLLAWRPYASRGWSRGWTYVAVMAGALAVRTLMVMIDAFVPKDPFATVLQHELGIVLTNLLAAGLIIGVIEEMRRIFLARVAAGEQVIPTAQIIMDWQGIIVGFNAEAAALLGYSEQEALGRELATLLLPESAREGHREQLEHYRHTGESSILNQLYPTQVLHKNGQIMPVNVHISQHIDSRGRSTFLGVIYPRSLVPL
jgi:PAS domain S-box-containing protein